MKLLSVVFALLVLVHPAASQGKTVVPEVVTSCGQTLSDGSYILNRDLLCADSVGNNIGLLLESGVKLDCQNHTIRCDSVSSDTAVVLHGTDILLLWHLLLDSWL